jgi:hypothetical protein
MQCTLSGIRHGTVVAAEVSASVEERVCSWCRILGIHQGDLLNLAVDFFRVPGKDVQLSEHLIVRYLNRLEAGYRPPEEVLRKMGEE